VQFKKRLWTMFSNMRRPFGNILVVSHAQQSSNYCTAWNPPFLLPSNFSVPSLSLSISLSLSYCLLSGREKRPVKFGHA
jgi:hypothetical protein